MSTDPPSWPSGDGEMARLIRGHDWAATPLGPIGDWPQSLRTTVELCLGSAVPSYVWWGPALVQLYNDAALAINRAKHPVFLGQPARAAWADVWAEVGPLFARVLATGEAVRGDDVPMVPERGGPPETAWFTFSYGPARDETGAVAGIFCTAIETTERVRAEAALRESGERLRRVLDGMGEGFGVLAPDFTALEHNREALRLDGRAREEIVGRSHWDAFPGTEDSELGRLLKRAMAERVPVALEHQYAWEAGRARWLEMRAYPTADGALAVFWRDVSDRREAQDALRASEERYRALFTEMDEAYAVVEVLADAAGCWTDFRFLEVNPAFMRHTGMPYPVGKTATELLGTPNPRWAELYGRAVETGESIRVEEGELTLGRVFDLNIFRLGGEESQRVAVLFNDITERKHREADRELLVALSGSLGRLAEEEALVDAAGTQLAAHLNLSGYHYVDVDEERGEVTVRHLWHAEKVPDIRGTYPIAGFVSPRGLERLRAGEPSVVDDVQARLHADDAATAALKAGAAAQHIGAYVAVPFSQNGRWRAYFAVADSGPRRWTAAEVELIQEVAGRLMPRIERVRAEAALRASEVTYRTLFESIDEGYALYELVFDAAGEPVDVVIHEVNAAYKRLTGRAEPEGKRLSEVSRGLDHDWATAMASVARSGTPARFERRNAEVDRWFDVYIAPVGDAGTSRLVMVLNHITERKRVEDALRASEARLREALEIETVGVVFYDDGGWVVEANDAFLHFAHVDREEVRAGTLHWHDLTAREWWPATRELFASLAVGRRAAAHEREFLRRGGPAWWGLAAPKRLADGRIVEYVLDVTARRRAEEALRESEELLQWRVADATVELRALSRRLLTIQEEERRFLARELHDEIGQVLTGLGLMLGTGNATEGERLAEARRIVGELTDQVRRLSMDLRPAALDSYGLLPALRWHLERYQQQTGIRVELRAEGVARRFPAEAEIAAYRIVQEALTNTARHAEAPEAIIQLYADAAMLTVSVRDRGRGFEPGTTSGVGGLSGMRERAELLGGTLVIDAEPGHGVVVTAELPIDAPEVEHADEEVYP